MDLQILDIRIFYFINHLPHNAVLDALAVFIHEITKTGIVYFVAALSILVQSRAKYSQWVLLGFFAGITTYLLNDLVLKILTGRLRPFQVLEGVKFLGTSPQSFAFPSGQSAVAFAIATIVWRSALPKKLKIIFLVFAFIVAVSRVYMGHHYPSDIVLGGILGSLIAWAIIKISKA